MADITLAECNEQVWLVGGEPMLDELLLNTLPASATVEIVSCAQMAEVTALWVQLSGPPQRSGDPWLLNPAIVTRVRNSIGGDRAVFFAQWSAFLDEDARVVIRAAAAHALTAGCGVAIMAYLDDTAAAPLTDLAALRSTLIEERLVAEGLPRERISRGRRPAGAVPGISEESQRLDLVFDEH